MRARLFLIALTGLSLLLGGCEEKKSNKIVLGKKATTDCSLTMDSLAGTQWVLLEIKPDKSEVPNIQTRLKLYEENGNLKAKYTVSSFSDVYTYNCKANANDLTCKEEPKVKDWCQALIIGGGECNAETLRGIDPDITDDEINKGIKEATEVLEKYKGNKQFEFNNNNLGNKLQGIIYLRIDERNCRLVITDNYMTIYNAKRIEDSNPVGTNPLVANEEDLMWEHCTDSADLIALKAPDFPGSEKEVLERQCIPNRGCSFGINENVYYQYIGQDGRTPENGCSYSYDTYVDWKPLEKAVAAQVVDGKRAKELRWPITTKYDKEGAHVMEIVRYKTCADGKKEQVEVSCNMILVQ